MLRRCISLIQDHPDMDMIVFNSGIQRGLNFADPASIKLDTVETELTTNYTSIIYFAKYFLPHLFAKKGASEGKNTAVVFVTSGLALIPIVRCGNYGASKAGMHHLIYSIREQLVETNVKIIELIPPAVQSRSLRLVLEVKLNSHHYSSRAARREESTRHEKDAIQEHAPRRVHRCRLGGLD